MQGNSQYPGIFFDALQSLYFWPKEGDKKIKIFIELAEHALKVYTSKSVESTDLINQLGSKATPIVTLLDTITIAYEHESKHRTNI